MVHIIKPARKKLIPDPFIAPISGDRGPCALCRNYSKLSESHVPPQSIGNVNEWETRSYLTALTSRNREVYYPRRFKWGLMFKTLCQGCNSKLGAREDKALADFFGNVQRLARSPLFFPTTTVMVPAKPNLIYRGLMAHIASANDSGMPSQFDEVAREIFFDRMRIGQSSWNLFYWLYEGENLLVARNVYFVTWSPNVDVQPMFLIKLRPLGFLFTQARWLKGLPNVKQFICQNDDQEAEMPVHVFKREADPFWPATVSNGNMIMGGGNTFGLIGSRR